MYSSYISVCTDTTNAIVFLPPSRATLFSFFSFSINKANSNSEIPKCAPPNPVIGQNNCKKKKKGEGAEESGGSVRLALCRFSGETPPPEIRDLAQFAPRSPTGPAPVHLLTPLSANYYLARHICTTMPATTEVSLNGLATRPFLIQQCCHEYNIVR